MNTAKPTPRVEEVIITRVNRGSGESKDDPARSVTKVYTTDGELIAEKDPHASDINVQRASRIVQGTNDRFDRLVEQYGELQTAATDLMQKLAVGMHKNANGIATSLDEYRELRKVLGRHFEEVQS